MTANAVGKRVRPRTRDDRKVAMSDDPQPSALSALVAAADRMDSLADIADLMGDRAGADRLRERSSSCRLRAMRLLDD